MQPHTAHVTQNSWASTLLVGPLKQRLPSQRFHNNEEVETVLREGLNMEMLISTVTEIFKLERHAAISSVCSGII